MAEAIYDYQFRLTVIGDSGAGKSSLIRWFIDRKTIDQKSKYRPTCGADCFMRIMQAEGCDTLIRLQIWDTTGQDKQRMITKSYLRNSIGVLLVFDITRRETFDDIAKWYEDSQVHVLPHKAIYVLVGNKVDLAIHNRRQVTVEEAQMFAQGHAMLYFETSAVTGREVEECFTALGQKIFLKLKLGEIKSQQGWEAIKDYNSADTKILLSASNRHNTIDQAISVTKKTCIQQ